MGCRPPSNPHPLPAGPFTGKCRVMGGACEACPGRASRCARGRLPALLRRGPGLG